MTSIDAKNGSPMARKLAARRLVYDAAPDSAGVMPTVLAPKYATEGAAPEQPGGENQSDLGMRRDLDAVMAQIAGLSGLVHQVFAQQTQQQNAAGMQLHPTAEGGAAEGDREISEEPLETAQQVQPEQSAAGEQRDEQDDQQGARGAHAGDRPEMYPQNGDNCLHGGSCERERAGVSD
jgi:hypothetical protein